VSVEGGAARLPVQVRYERSQRPTRRQYCEGATVLIDRISLGYLAGSEIDHIDDLIGASFKINIHKPPPLRLRHQFLDLGDAASVG
jgi:Fe-S cluster assembly iron-binding protein IscA